jgi:hypothetical protein
MAHRTKHEAWSALKNMARNSGDRGAGFKSVETLTGMGVAAGLGAYWEIYKRLARHWAYGARERQARADAAAQWSEFSRGTVWAS